MNLASTYCGLPNLAGFVLVPSATVTATGTGTATASRIESQLGEWQVLMFQLDLTAAATAVGDTLDVFIQTSFDGTNFVDIVHFTQMLGNGGAKRFFTKIVASQTQAEFENGTALGAAAVRHLFGDVYRARWTVVTATAPSFTFSVTMNCK